MPPSLLQGQWLIYYFSSHCKAAWQAFEDKEDSWTESPEKHMWWTKGLHAEGERLALAIGYHVADGSVVKIPAWVSSFMHATHVQDTEFAILPPLDLFPNTTYPDDPSRIVSSYHADWWNTEENPCLPKPYSKEEMKAFDAWLQLVDQPLSIDSQSRPLGPIPRDISASAARAFECLQSALIRIEVVMANWRDARKAARWCIGTLEALLEKVHQGNLSLDILADLPIPPCPWLSNDPPKNKFLPYLLPHGEAFPPPSIPQVPLSVVEETSSPSLEPLLPSITPRGSTPSEGPLQSPGYAMPRRLSPLGVPQGTPLQPPHAPWGPSPLDGMVVDLAPPSLVSSADLDWDASGSDSAEDPDYEMSEGFDGQGSAFESDAA